MSKNSHCISIFLKIFCIGLITILASCGGKSDTTVTSRTSVSVSINFGMDVGDSYGSIFEAYNEHGQVVAGAGFVDAYNTRGRTDRYKLQFFVVPPEEQAFQVERLPSPNIGHSVHLIGSNNELLVNGSDTKKWDASSSKWVSSSAHNWRQRVSGGEMVLNNGYVTYEGKMIVADSQTGGIHKHFYYAHSRIFFVGSGKNLIYACPWSPQSEGEIDLVSCDSTNISAEETLTWAWGQGSDYVIYTSRTGGIYLFRDNQWSKESSLPGGSQIYSTLAYQDRNILGHYPSGEAYVYEPHDQPQQLTSQPPTLEYADRSSRELQTLYVYRGNLVAGVWPWAELWFLGPNNNLSDDLNFNKWFSGGRLFSHPSLSQTGSRYPYEDRGYGNEFGQRITSMVTIGDSLYIGTAAKSLGFLPQVDFMSQNELSEYGSIIKFTMEGNLAVVADWRQDITQFDFVITKNKIEIYQDGIRLGSSNIQESTASYVNITSIAIGKGVFGPGHFKDLEIK